jgi:hypothetical protein
VNKQSQFRPSRRTIYPTIPLFYYSTIPSGGRSCGTKPICPATPRGARPGGRGTRGKCAKRTQFGPGGQEGSRVGGRARRGTTAPNKANFGRRNGRGKWLAGKELWYIAPAIGFGKTKPIFRNGPRGARDGGATSRAGAAAYCAKQTQFAAAGPGRPSPRACPERSERAGGLDAATHGANVRNKANSGPSQVGRGQRDGGRGRNAPNEPNWPGRAGSRRAKDAKGTQFPAGPGGTEANGCCTNKPNHCRYADPEIGVPWRGKSCETKPNLGRMGYLGDGAPGRWRLCETNPIWPVRRRDCLYKQTQFPWRYTPVFHYSIIPRFQSDANRANRSHLPYCPRNSGRMCLS